MQKNKNEVNSPKYEIRPASSEEAGLSLSKKFSGQFFFPIIFPSESFR